ncbi:MAG: hypothetical protein P8Q95_01940 [Candidatus Poseidoniaceae archaeon]|nr:hypothetical protein [Candidatus Poseidoniaceae archaeon]
MARLAIRTANFQLSYKLIQSLRSRKIVFDVMDISENFTSNDIIWFAEGSEIIGRDSVGKAIPTSVDTIDSSIEFALLILKGLDEPNQLVFGIDPGPYPGLAWLVDGVFIGVSQLQSLEEISNKVKSVSNSIPAHSVLIRIGNGDPLIRDRIINLCIEHNWNIEVVDESKTSRGLLRHNHSISALRIASITGIRVWELREINPLPGQIKEIQRQSRKFSKGKLTIPYGQAELVAKGELSLSEAVGDNSHSSEE